MKTNPWVKGVYRAPSFGKAKHAQIDALAAAWADLAPSLPPNLRREVEGALLSGYVQNPNKWGEFYKKGGAHQDPEGFIDDSKLTFRKIERHLNKSRNTGVDIDALHRVEAHLTQFGPINKRWAEVSRGTSRPPRLKTKSKARSNPAIVPIEKGGRTVYAIAGTHKWFTTRAKAEEHLHLETPKGKRIKQKYVGALRHSRAVDAWLDADKGTRARWNSVEDWPLHGTWVRDGQYWELQGKGRVDKRRTYIMGTIYEEPVGHFDPMLITPNDSFRSPERKMSSLSAAKRWVEQAWTKWIA